jgi:Derlin-2/3
MALASCCLSLRCSLFGVVPVTAPYLPWVLLGLTLTLGSSGAVFDLIGIAVGHVYFYLEDVYPAVAESRGWRVTKILPTPTTVYVLCGCCYLCFLCVPTVILT